MTVNPSIDPARLLEEQLAQASPDLLRELLGTFINTLLSAEADAVCGAEYGTRTPDRVNRRNGYRHRDATNEHATAVRNLEPDPWLLGDEPTRPLRAHGAVLGDLADLRRSARWIGLPA